ncbi:1-(5-phosphoribosyl)-5-[(5-phosphoribosylamino)methylideneamino]imidazole-4-carboxamide isomerase [Oceanobacillus sp. FSL K6-2867]|uniref:1-(5-phosphoribosyl)-5-[(5- phosphoribosylamino)methylideneamino]imidazole-4- carboxamide isomerase n=1 Tax=Oceanobacillus sp. FSL K6-2867 TaxID=2954748 RepID=UPI0030DC5072
MILFPAIDIRGGNCVRLIQGDYNKEKVYGNSPTDMALQWENKRAAYLHTVDLDGAKTGDSLNRDAIKAIAKQTDIPVQVGGGIRSLDTIEDYLNAGIARVIIGTAAITDKVFLKDAVEKFGSRIAVSIDARNGYVATDGWTETSSIKAIDLVTELEQLGVETIVYTDIMKDGMLQGPNFEELQAVNEATSMDVIASGGVSTKEDINKLKSMNMYGAIIGKALYDGTLNFEELTEDDSYAR